MKEQDEIMNYASIFADAIEDVLFNKNNKNYINIEETNNTDIFTGLALSFGVLYNKYCEGDYDAIDYTHIANKLIVQYLLYYKR